MTNNLTQHNIYDDNNKASTPDNKVTHNNRGPVFESQFEKDLFIQEVRRIAYLIFSKFPSEFRYQKDLVLDFGNDHDKNNEDALCSFLQIQLPIFINESPHRVAKKLVGVICDHLEER